MDTKNLLRRATLAAILVTVSACSTVMTAPPSGFLSHEVPAHAPHWHAGVPIDPARTTLAPVQWRAGDVAGIDADRSGRRRFRGPGRAHRCLTGPGCPGLSVRGISFSRNPAAPPRNPRATAAA